MNKIIKLLVIIAGCLATHVGMASAPAKPPTPENTSFLVLMKNLKNVFKNYYDTYSHSPKKMKNIDSNDNNHKEFITFLKEMIDQFSCVDLLNTITDEEKNTPLILAAKYNCQIMIKYLIEECDFTNFDAKNIYGRTAYDYVRTPSDQIGSSEFDDYSDCFKIFVDEPENFYEALKPVFEGSIKPAEEASKYAHEVKLKHKPIIHGDKTVAEYLKSKRLKYKFDQAVARDPRLMALRAQDAKSAAQRAKQRADKKQNNDKTLQEIREKTRAARAERTEGERVQAVGISSTTPAQQLEEATRLALVQAQKAKEEASKQEKNIIYKLQMELVKAQRTKKLLQAWKWAALESQRKKEVAAAAIAQKNKGAKAELEWLITDQQRKERVDALQKFKQSKGSNNPLWYARCYQVYTQSAGNALALAAGSEDQSLLQWWQESHDQSSCTVCKQYMQAQLVVAANPKQLQRCKSF